MLLQNIATYGKIKKKDFILAMKQNDINEKEKESNEKTNESSSDELGKLEESISPKMMAIPKKHLWKRAQLDVPTDDSEMDNESNNNTKKRTIFNTYTSINRLFRTYIRNSSSSR